MIKEVLLRTIAGSGGYSFIITDEYFQLPRITLSKAEGLVFLHLPYYVQSLSLVGWLNNVLGNALGDDLASGRFKRHLVTIPNPIKGIDGILPRDTFSMSDPCTTFQGLIKASEYEQADANALILSDLIAPRIPVTYSSP